jgi:hypothetical protein
MSSHATLRTQAPAAGPVPRRRSAVAPAPLGILPGSLLTWYLGLVPYWMRAPSRERRILLRTPQRIVERVLAPEVGLAAAAADLAPDGDLTRILTDMAPAEPAERWRHFIQVVVANLRHALLLPVARRNEAWVRWLFLIPYSVRSRARGAPLAP